MKRFDDKTLPSSCHVTCGLISGAEGLNFSPRRRGRLPPPLRRHRTATRTQKTKRRLRLVEDEMAPFDGDRRDIPLTRRRRRRPPDNLSPTAASSSSLFAATAALLLIVCCAAAAAAAGVAAGIPTQLSPEVEEHLGGGGGGVSLFPFPVRSQQHDVDDGETGTEHRTKTSNEEKSGNGKTLEETEEKEDEDEDEEPGVAPPYMLELYRKFSNDKQSPPTADIVRSFKNINSGGVTSVSTSDNCTWTALHSLHFNISSSSSSIIENEDVQMAELRLRTSKKTLTVLVYEVIAPSPDRSPPPPPPPQPLSRLLTSRDVSPEERSTWQTFSVTEALRRWTKKQTTSVGHVFQVRVDTVHRSNDDDEPDAAGSDVSADDDKTILVVFSNDRKRRRVASRELREIQTHENEAREKEERRRRRMRRRRNRRHYYPPSSRSSPTPRPSSPKEEEEEESTSDAASTGLRTRPAASFEGRMTTNRTAVDREGLKNRSRSRGRRRGRRNSCRRKPMYVDFLDVKWENWVIQPSGYQAYECTGQCYFPIVQRLTPTKYAVVKSLLHATYPKRAGAACCVPTRLEPIPLLYRDEQGVVTYQSQYEDMVVAECGCR